MRSIKDKKNFLYAFVSMVFTIITNQLVYQGTKIFSLRFKAWDISTPLDHMFKPVPWTISIYVGSFIIWAVSYCVRALQDDRKKSERFFSAILLSRLFVAIIFLVFPTTAQLRVELTGKSFWEWATRFIYSADSPAVNYFPSMHCMASWFCFIGVRGKKEFPLWWRITSFVLAIAVFVSTITTRQHVLVDIPGGIIFAELSYALSDHEGVQRFYTRISTWIMRKLFHWESIEG